MHLDFFQILPLKILLSHFIFFLGLLGLSTIITRAMFRRVQIMDVPNQRSSHSVSTPKSGGIAIVATFLCGVLAQGSTFVYINCYAIGAGAFGFLIFNFPPARIFMGDVGSAFLGFVFAVLAMIAARHDHSHTSFLVMPLLLFHFIFDTSFTFLRRILRGDQVTQAHRTHLYQLMNQLGSSHLKVALFQYAMVICQGIGAIYMINTVSEYRVLIFIPFLIFQICYGGYIVTKSKKKGLLSKP